MASMAGEAKVERAALLQAGVDGTRGPPPGGARRRAAACSAAVLAGGLALAAAAQLGRAPRQHSTGPLSHVASLAATGAVRMYRIKSVRTGHCLDWDVVVVRPKQCDARDEKQAWTYNSTSHHIKVPDGRCLDAGGANVHIWKCAPEGKVAVNQHWQLDIHTNQIKHLAFKELCLQEDDSTGAVNMKPCDKYNKGQQWSLHINSAAPAAAAPAEASEGVPAGYAVVRHGQGLCLDAGGKMHLWPCDPSNTNQQWTEDTSSGQIKSRKGGCLDAASTTALRPCSVDSEYETWTLRKDSGLLEVRHGDAARCLSAQAPGRKGSAISLEACDEHSKNQQWGLDDLATASQQSGGCSGFFVVAVLACMALGAGTLCYLYRKEMERQAAERRQPLPTNDPEAPAEAKVETTPEAAQEAALEAEPEAAPEAAPQAAPGEAQAEANAEAEAEGAAKKAEGAEPLPSALGA